MFYRLDKSNLIWEPDRKKLKISMAFITVALFLSFISGRYAKFKSIDKLERELLILNIQEEKNQFTEEKLISEIKRLNIRFPYIVMAQAKLESNNFSSSIFTESHNMFGMKEATSRINLAEGTERGHAYYNDWRESILDYAFWEATYGSKCRNEDEYFQLLSNYAEDNTYSSKLKNIIEKENLKNLF